MAGDVSFLEIDYGQRSKIADVTLDPALAICTGIKVTGRLERVGNKAPAFDQPVRMEK